MRSERVSKRTNEVKQEAGEPQGGEERQQTPRETRHREGRTILKMAKNATTTHVCVLARVAVNRGAVDHQRAVADSLALPTEEVERYEHKESQDLQRPGACRRERLFPKIERKPEK
jgi:hypothetical protein